MKFFGRSLRAPVKSIWAVLFMINYSINSGSSQIASGLHNENYAGIHGIITNPAFGPHGYLGWDVNLGSAHLFFQNNYGFITNTHLLDLLGNTAAIELVNSEDPATTGARILDFYSGRNSYYFSVNLDVMGPSFYAEIGKFGMGLFTRGRISSSSQRIPGQLGYYEYTNLAINNPTVVSPFQAGALAWTEYGANLSSASLFSDRRLSLGLNLKYLVGHEGFYAHSLDMTNLVRLSGDQIEVSSGIGEYALTNGIADPNNLDYQSNGRGMAIDLGASYELDRMRIGISILDIGRIKFSQNAAWYRLIVNDALTIPLDDLTNSDNPGAVIQTLNQIVVSNGLDSTLQSESFTMSLPARLSLGIDYYLFDQFYVSGTLVQRLNQSKSGIHADNSITVTPRFEKRWLSVSVPLTVHNYQTFRPGFATRLGILTIGSDDVLSLFGGQDFNGSSLYVALKINPFKRKTDEKGYTVNCPRIKRSPWNSHEPVKSARRNN